MSNSRRQGTPHHAEDRVSGCYVRTYFSFFLLRCGIFPTGVAAAKDFAVGGKERVKVQLKV